MDDHKIRYLSILPNSIEEIQVLLKSQKRASTLREEQYTFMIISRSFILRMINILDKFSEKV